MTFADRLEDLRMRVSTEKNAVERYRLIQEQDALLANNADAILELVRAANSLESWLGKTVGSDENAQVEILATDIGAEGTCERLQRLKNALAKLNGGQT